MKLFRWLHKWLGIVTAPLVLMFFVSGIFMIFGDFPRAGKERKLELLEPIGRVDSLPITSELSQRYARLTSEDATLHALSIEASNGTPLLTLRGSEGPIILDPTLWEEHKPLPPTLEEIEASAMRLTGQKPSQIDTLNQLNQWIPFSARRADLPFLKASIPDGKGTALYFSGTTGQLLQETNNQNRFYAYLSAIPHWIYIWQLRQDVELWKDVIIVFGIIACVMIVSGLVLGIYRTMQSRRSSKRRWSPFGKRSGIWHYWHHITGLIFGWVALTWLFSGWMSVDKLPKWMTGEPPREELYGITSKETLAGVEQPNFNTLLAKYPSTKRITYAHYLGQPYYTLEREGETLYLMPLGGGFAPLLVTPEVVTAYLRESGKGIEVTNASTLHHYTSDYMPHPRGKHAPPLPALQVETKEGTTLYIGLETPSLRVSNKATRLNGWAYQKLHSFRYLWAYRHPTLWLIVMLVLLAGGTVLSFTGVVLGWKALFKKKKKRKQRPLPTAR